MVSAEKDVAPVQVSGLNTSAASDNNNLPAIHTEYLPAIQILNRRGEYSATMGCIPPLLRPCAARLPWFKQGLESVSKLAGIAIAAVNTRLEEEESLGALQDQDGGGGGGGKSDLLSKLIHARDEKGELMGKEELTAEALTQLIAGESSVFLL